MASTRLSVPHLKPTLEQMQDFIKYIDHVEESEAQSIGLAKITPPAGWQPASADYLNRCVPSIKLDMVPKQRFVTTSPCVYYWEREDYEVPDVSSFMRFASSPDHDTPKHDDFEELEKIYWKTLKHANPIYGSDIQGSLFDDSCKSFNLQNLNTILQQKMREAGLDIPGINNPYLYFGMWQSTFPWHTEDFDLYSINYLHYGAPKHWYVIPPSHGQKFEALVRKYFPKNVAQCKGYLRHKTLVISPEILELNDILYASVTQEAGDFIISLPAAYHSGFNHGFNVAEATNFATDRWIKFGLVSSLSACDCPQVNPVRMDIYRMFYNKSGRFKRVKDAEIEHPLTKEKIALRDLKTAKKRPRNSCSTRPRDRF